MRGLADMCVRGLADERERVAGLLAARRKCKSPRFSAEGEEKDDWVEATLKAGDKTPVSTSLANALSCLIQVDFDGAGKAIGYRRTEGRCVRTLADLNTGRRAGR